MERISVLCWVLASIFGLMAGWYELRDRLQSEANRNATRENYSNLLLQISSKKFSQLPYRMIVIFLNMKNRITYKVHLKARSIMRSPRNRNSFRIANAVIISIGLFKYIGVLFAVSIGISQFLLWNFAETLVKRIHKFIWDSNGNLKRNKLHVFKPISIGFMFIIVGIQFLGILLFIIQILTLPLEFSVIGITMALPIIAISIGYSIFQIRHITKIMERLYFPRSLESILDRGYIIGVSLSLSFCLTGLSIWIGQIHCASCQVDFSFQILISNTLFDAITLILTFKILENCLPLITSRGNSQPTINKPLKIPIGVLLDILISCLCACLSIYFCFLLTDNHISLYETFELLLGRNIEGSHYWLNSYFWLMHTTFAPTLAYLLIIFFAWVCKVLLIPLTYIYSMAAINEKPHRLIAGTCGLLAIIFTIISSGIDKCL